LILQIALLTESPLLTRKFSQSVSQSVRTDGFLRKHFRREEELRKLRQKSRKMSTQAPDSLVKYDNPTLVSTSITNKRGKAKAKGKNTAALTKQEQVRQEKEKRD